MFIVLYILDNSDLWQVKYMGHGYRIMIVDDEADMREGIVECVAWEELGFEVAAQAENGKDALDKLESIDVDVILTDIKMPFLDGLAMTERVSVLYPSIKIIILSGFDEFEYAKAAIKLNVIEYVLKPINAAELSDVIRRVGSSLDRDLERQRDIDILTQSYNRYIPVMREHFITELLWGTLSQQEIEEKLQSFDLPIAKHKNRIVVSFNLDASQSSEVISQELVPVSINEMMCSRFEGRCEYVTFIASRLMVIITAWEEAKEYDQVISITNDICARCQRVLGLTLTAGIGRCFESPADICISYRESQRALEYRHSVGDGRAIFIADMEGNRKTGPYMDWRQEEYMLSLIKFGYPAQIEEMALRLVADAENSDTLERSSYMAGMYQTMFRLCKDHGLEELPEAKEQLEKFIDTNSLWERPEQMGRWLQETCLMIHQLIKEKRKSATKIMAETAVQYIEQHYGDSQISVEQLCSHLHVSQSYFSTVFRQEIGESFIKYLTDLRMRRAKELLEQTQDKTYMISAKVGYDEPNYFSYVFKKHYGISPTKHRRQIKEKYEEGV